MVFLSNNIEFFITASVIIVALLSVMFLKPFLEKHGYIKKEQLDDAEVIIAVVRIVLNELKFKDEENKSRVEKMLNVIDLAIKHVQGLIGTDNTDKLVELSYNSILKSLEEMNITVDDDEKKAIRYAIQIGIEKMNIQ